MVKLVMKRTISKITLMKHKSQNISIVFLVLLLFIANLFSILPLPETEDTINCEPVNYFMSNFKDVEIKEVSIYPEIENIKCLGKIKDNRIIKSTNFYLLMKFLNYLTLFLLFIRKPDLNFLLFGTLTLLISLKFNPDISYWHMLKEYLLFFVIFQLNNSSEKSILINWDKYVLKLYFIIISIISFVIYLYDWKSIWKYLGVPSLSPSMIDLHAIGGATISYLDGYDPHYFNPGDPKGRLFTHPNIWTKIGEYLGLNNDFNLYIFGAFMIFMYLTVNLLLIQKNPSFVLLMGIISYPTFFAIERGQNDLLMFVLIYIGLNLNKSFRFIVLWLATILKIYPIFVFSHYFKKQLGILIPLSIGFLTLLLNINEIIVISDISPQTYWSSFGVGSMNILTKEYIFNNLYLLYFLIIFSTITTYIYLNKKFDRVFNLDIDNKKDSVFFAGVSIYIGLFFFTSSYDYKLIFLILCIPYLVFQKNKYSNYMLSLILLSSNEDLFSYHFGINGVFIVIIFKFILFICFSTIFLNYIKKVFTNISIRK